MHYFLKNLMNHSRATLNFFINAKKSFNKPCVFYFEMFFLTEGGLRIYRNVSKQKTCMAFERHFQC